MVMRQKKPATTHFGIRISVETKKELQKLARANYRSASKVAEMAIERFLKEARQPSNEAMI